MSFLKLSIMVFLLIFSYSNKGRTEVSNNPKPFCAPNEFQSYVSSKNHDRIKFIIENCKHINLNEVGSGGMSLALLLGETLWEDIFNLLMLNSDFNFNPAIKNLIKAKKYSWINKILTRITYVLDADDQNNLIKDYPNSKDMITSLYQNKNLDPNIKDKESRNFLTRSLESLKVELITNVRQWPSVDKSEFFARLCKLFYDKERGKQFSKYFEENFGNEDYDLATLGGNNCNYISFVGYGFYSLEFIKKTFNNPNLDISSDYLSYTLTNMILETKNLLLSDIILSHPKFNFEFKFFYDGITNTFWNLMPRRYLETANEIYKKYSSKIGKKYLNYIDKDTDTPLSMIIYRSSREPKNEFINKFFEIEGLDLELPSRGRVPIIQVLEKSFRSSNGEKSNLDAFFKLIDNGANPFNVGDKDYAMSSIVSGMTYNPNVFKIYIDWPELNKADYLSMLFRNFFSNAYSCCYNGENFLNSLKVILNKSNFDFKVINEFRPKDISFGGDTYDLKYSVVSMIYREFFNSPNISELFMEILYKIINNSNTASLFYNFSDNYNHSSNSFIGLVILRQDIKILDYLFTKNMINITDLEESADYAIAVATKYDKRFNSFEYLVEKNAVSSIPEEFMRILIRNKKYDCLKKLLSSPKFKLTYPVLYLLDDSKEESELFELIISKQKVSFRDELFKMVTIEKSSMIRLDRIITNVSIANTKEDKEFYFQRMNQMIENRTDIKIIDKLLKKTNFECNQILGGQRTSSILSNAISTLNLEYIKYFYSIKSCVSDLKVDITPIEALFSALIKQSHGYDQNNPFNYKYKDRREVYNYVMNLPSIKPILPTINGEDIFVAFSKMKEAPEDILTFMLESKKFKFTTERMQKIYEFLYTVCGSYKYTIEGTELFLNAFFNYPYSKPFNRWNNIIIPLYFSKSTDLLNNFIFKYGHELNLNIILEKDISLVKYSIDENPLLLEYLIKNPNVKISPWDINKILVSANPQNLSTFYNVRIKSIPQEDLLYTLRYLITYEMDSSTIRLKEILPYVKNLNSISKLKDEKDIFHELSVMRTVVKNLQKDEIYQTLFNRLLSEDKSLKDEAKKSLYNVFKYGKWEVLDQMVQNGYDVRSPIIYIDGYSYPPQLIGALLKSIPILEYLEKKYKIGYDLECLSDDCALLIDAVRMNAYGIALTNQWMEGVEYYISKKVDPNKLFQTSKYNSYSSLNYALVNNKIELLKYLLSVGANFNEEGLLVTTILKKNDQALELLFDLPNLNPNITGTESNTKRTTYPIIEAARLGRVDYVKKLLSHSKIRKNATDSSGYRAIDWAATNGFEEIVMLLK